MTTRKKEIPVYELTGELLKAFNAGYWDGNEGNYFPCSHDTATYDRGYKAGKKYGPRKGKPWTLKELTR